MGNWNIIITKMFKIFIMKLHNNMLVSVILWHIIRIYLLPTTVTGTNAKINDLVQNTLDQKWQTNQPNIICVLLFSFEETTFVQPQDFVCTKRKQVRETGTKKFAKNSENVPTTSTLTCWTTLANCWNLLEKIWKS